MDLREKEMGLGEFGEFLLRRRIVPERNAKYYVGWVRRFLGAAPDPRLALGERMEGFVEGLRASGNWEDWQIEQAERAVKVYFHTFRNGEGLEGRPAARVERDAAGRVSAQAALAAARELLRTKHYSYRTIWGGSSGFWNIWEHWGPAFRIQESGFRRENQRTKPRIARMTRMGTGLEKWWWTGRG